MQRYNFDSGDDERAHTGGRVEVNSIVVRIDQKSSRGRSVREFPNELFVTTLFFSDDSPARVEPDKPKWSLDRTGRTLRGTYVTCVTEGRHVRSRTKTFWLAIATRALSDKSARTDLMNSSPLRTRTGWFHPRGPPKQTVVVGEQAVSVDKPLSRVN